MTNRPPFALDPDVLKVIAENMNTAADMNLETAARLEQIAQRTDDPDAKKLIKKAIREARKLDKKLTASGIRGKPSK